MPDTLRQDLEFDLVAFDEHDRPVLVAEVKAMTGAIQVAIPWLNRLESDLRSAGRPIPYWMFVDGITFFYYGDGSQPARVTSFVGLETALSAYDPEIGRKRIFDDYLLALVEAWLRDVASDWRLADPPAMEQLGEIGLSERLKGGTIRRGVSLADLDPLRGNQLRDESLPGTRLGDG